MNQNNIISIISQSNLADTPFFISLSNLPPESYVDIRMTIYNYYCINAPMYLNVEVPWRSQATFKTRGDGSLRLDRDPALAGSYTGVLPMGLFAACKPLKSYTQKLSQKISDISLYPSYDILVEVIERGIVVAQKTVTRYYQLPSIESKDVDFSHAKGRFFYNPLGGRKPSIIVLSGSDGRIEKAQNIAQVLSGHGYSTLALGYFGLQGISSHLCKIPVEIIKDSISFLQNNPYVDSNRIGLYGRSKGAELALLASSIFPEISCTVLNSPFDAVLEGIRGKINSRASSWTYKGHEVPYTKFNLMNYIFDKIFKVQRLSIKPSSVIPVEKIKGDLLMLGSTRDEVWNTKRAIKSINERIQAWGGGTGMCELFMVDTCGHMMTIAYQPNHRYGKQRWEGTMNDTCETWQKTCEFFEHSLKEAAR